VAKQGEIDYLKKLGEAGIRHATDKPFSDAECGALLMELGAILNLLPPPPARLLDLGCGTGWTSCFFARRGYEVVGQDIAADMIEQAHENKIRYRVENVHFVECDYEDFDFEDEFDAAVFFDSLHHSLSEEDALRQVYRALKPGGVCVTSEPGLGHAGRPASRNAVERYDVTERDMHPGRIIRAGKKAGFARFRTFPHARQLSACLYGVSDQSSYHRVSRLPAFLKLLALVAYASLGKRITGIVMMTK
jgi:SAM-dependent methyltransferase